MEINDLFTILSKEKPSKYIRRYEDKIFDGIPGLKICKNFNKDKKWNGPNIYEHTLSVVDNVPNKLELRLAALFHDISKPGSYQIDEKNKIYFKDNWLVSADIFRGFANEYNIDSKLKETVIKLILFQSININNLTEKDLQFLTNKLKKEEIIMLYELKKAEITAQSKYYIDKIEETELKNKTINYVRITNDNYKKQTAKILKRYEG